MELTLFGFTMLVLLGFITGYSVCYAKNVRKIDKKKRKYNG